MSRWDYLQLFPHFHFLPFSSCRTIMKLASSPVFSPAFSFPKHLLRLEPSSLNLWMTILYRTSLCSIPCSILSITPSASYSISGNGITACPIRKLTNGNHGLTEEAKVANPVPCNSRNPSEYCTVTVDYQWCPWGWPVVEAREIWSEPWGWIIHWQRFFNVTPKSVFGTR